MTRPEPRDASPTRRLLVAVALVIIALAVALAVTAAVLLASRTTPRAAASTLKTVKVTSGDVVTSTEAIGSLLYAQQEPLTTERSGVLTRLPAVGSTVAPGGELYSVDASPVILLRGSFPAWRSFATGMSDGDDVLQLEQNLRAIGVFSATPDRRFTAQDGASIRELQRRIGWDRTGVLARESIRFADHDLRVAEPTVRVGAVVGPGTELYTASSTTKVVDLDLPLEDQAIATVGAAATVRLPDGATSAGTIASVGEPTQRTADGSGSVPPVVIPIEVGLTDLQAAAAFARATVTVQFPRTLGSGVLTVPVEALVATSADRYAVEVPRGRRVSRVPVTLGPFGSGLVQIRGRGIVEGVRVVVPE